MGQGCCACLKHVKRISVQTYHSEAEDLCACGKCFASPDANFCCHCGESREGPTVQRKLSSASDTSRQSSASGSKFSNIMPGTVPVTGRTTRRAGTSGTNSTASSRTTAEASDDDEKHISPRDRDRHDSASSSAKDNISVASDRTGESSSPKLRKQKLGVNNGKKRSPEGSRSPRDGSSPKYTLTSSSEAGYEDMVSALSKALKHSGSFVTKNVQMRALQVPEGLSTAYTAQPKPDMQMPPFEAKVDQDNLLKKLPQGPLKAHQLSLQRVTFMSTDWLGLRLEHDTHSQRILFCLCVTALQNIGKNTSRSVVVETSNAEAEQFGFACAPTFGHKQSNCSTSFIDHAEDISELAQIFLNEDGNPQKKIASDLKKWCLKNQEKLVGQETVAEDTPKSRGFSLRGLFASIEESLGNLGGEGHPSKPQGRRNSNASINGARRNSNASINAEHRGRPAQDRRKSLPPGLEFSSKRHASPPKSRSSDTGRSGGSDKQQTKSKRSPELAQSQADDRSHMLSTPERRRRNSDPGLSSTLCLSDEEAVMKLKMKRKKSLDATIMPTLNEDEDSESKEVSLATTSVTAIGRPAAENQSEIPVIPEL